VTESAVKPDRPQSGDAAPAPVEENAADKASRTLIMTAAVICMFMAAIESTVVATAMPTIVGQLGDFHLFSWVFSIYLLSQSVTLPLAGRFADLFGRKPIIYLGLVLFLGGSTACGLAPSMVTLIGFRVVQGIGAGCVTPVTQTIISDLYPPAARARIQRLSFFHLDRRGDRRPATRRRVGDASQLALDLLGERADRHPRLRLAKRGAARGAPTPCP